jgi:hypothetical protein
MKPEFTDAAGVACTHLVATENGLIVAFMLGAVSCALVAILAQAVAGGWRVYQRARWHGEMRDYYEEQEEARGVYGDPSGWRGGRS